MIARLRHYYLNLGTFSAAFNLSMLILLVVIIVRSAGSTAGVVLIPLGAVGLLLPRVCLPLLLRHSGPVMKSLWLAQWAIIPIVVLHLTNVIDLPGLAVAGLFLGVCVFHGVLFWMMSDPRVLTGEGMRRSLERQVAAAAGKDAAP